MYKQTAAELRAWAEAHKALVKVQRLVARRKKRNKLKKETK
jgi:GH24 family phage-related lysozyme (muramidase)